MKISYSSNDGDFTMETIRKGEILDRIVIYQCQPKNRETACAHCGSIQMSELGFAMLLVEMAKADPNFYTMIRKIEAESRRFPTKNRDLYE